MNPNDIARVASALAGMTPAEGIELHESILAKRDVTEGRLFPPASKVAAMVGVDWNFADVAARRKIETFCRAVELLEPWRFKKDPSLIAPEGDDPNRFFTLSALLHVTGCKDWSDLLSCASRGRAAAE